MSSAHPHRAHGILGDVPEGTDLRLRAPSRNISLGASSVGRGSKLLLVGSPRSQVVVEGFTVIHLIEALPQALVISADANIHLLTGGSLILRAVDSAAGLTARAWFDEASKSPGTVTLQTSVPLTGISGRSTAAVDLRAHANADGCPVAAGTKVDLPNCRELKVQGRLERCKVDLPGRLVSTGGLVGSCEVTAGTVQVGPNVGSTTWRPTDDVMADAGTTVRASKGRIAIAGRVQGTVDRPVTLTGAMGKDVQLGEAEHTSVQAVDGQRLGAVTVGPSSNVKVRGASTIGDQGTGGEQHVAPDMEATTRIALTGQVHEGTLRADAVRVRDVVGPASLMGRTVALATSAQEHGGTVSIEAAEWIKAASSCDLHVTACGPDPCQVLISKLHGNPAHVNRPPDPLPEDPLAEGVAELGRDNDKTARLDLHGRLQVECSAAITIVRAAEQVVSLRTGGQLRMPAGGTVGQVRSAGELHLGGDGSLEVVLHARDVKAPAILRGSEEGPPCVTVEASGAVQTKTLNVDELACARLHVDGDAHLGALRVTEDTHIGGRVAAAEGPAKGGPYRLSGTVNLADVDVPLTLEYAHANIKASEAHDGPEGDARPPSVIGELRWERPTGSLYLEHSVSVLRVKSPQEQAVLEAQVPSRCKRIEVDGKLLVRSSAGTRASNKGGRASSSDTEPDKVEQPRIVLADGSKLSLALAQPVWIDLRDDAEAAVRIEDSQTVLHLVEEAISGQLALSVPCKGSKGRRMVRLHSSAIGATGSQIPRQPTIVVQQGDLLLSGAFNDVLALEPVSGKGSEAPPTTVHIPAETVVHQMRGVVALGEFHGRVTGAEARHGLLHRFTSQEGPRWGWTVKLQSMLGGLLNEPSVEDRLVLVNPVDATDDSGQEAISKGVLVEVDVTQLSFAELDRLEGLDVFSPDPVALERKARARPPRAAGRQSNAQHLSRIAQLVEGRSVTGSVRSMANWAASTAHATTGRGFERIGRRIARTLGYGQRPLPALALLVLLVAVTTVVLSITALEAGVCRSWFNDPTGADALANYNWVQHLERVLLAPLAFLRVAGPLQLEPLGCNPLVQVVGTVVVALPLAFLLIGLRNYLRSPVDR